MCDGRIHFRLQFALRSPSPNFFCDSEVSSGILLKPTSERVRIDFQRDGLVASSIQKAAHVKFRKPWNAKLPMLFHVHKFVKQQPA